MNRSLRFLLVSLAALTVAVAVRAEPAILTKARAYLGSEASLDAVKSIHFIGSLVSDETPGKPPVAIDIVFQKPHRQRIMATSAEGVQTTGLDNYEAWQRIQDPKDVNRWRLTLLAKEQVKRLRANTWETLAFFRGLERQGGQIEERGSATTGGIATQKVAFIHGPDIIFYRYFDQATGRLVLTETESGATLREQGEIIVDGVRFPKVVINTRKVASGKEATDTITFDKIVLNENFADSVFSVPTIGSK